MLIATLMPLFKMGHWIVRGFDFPFVQFTILGFFVVIGWVVLTELTTILHISAFASLAIAVLYRSSIIYPYLKLAKITVPSEEQTGEEDTLKILSSNVLMYNDNYDGLLNIIKEKDPDVVLLLEADEKWREAVAYFISTRYSHSLLYPTSNTYGMLLYSKLQLEESELRFLVEGDVPSIRSVLCLKNGRKINFYGLHPKPPSPSENTESTPRDAELVLVGRECRQSELPVIVAGDMNDVAWSHTTRLFLRISGLLDPRMGRGFFSTYNAKYSLIRWPLDHVFLSPHFKILEMSLLDNFGSDHFPIFISLSFAPSKIARQEVEHPDKSDRREGDQKLEDADVN